ncbi:nuclear transport factor 2 family protein [Pseudonocardia xinjiangensis]|uniref:SnoaL-like domain-containing protein n=1 Tax=Pseudonocardia xinjiangensis TaxID=75289 RepID=A0ABX1R7W9_9PSEU|nr:nuclear transport factor 2 family protein [Pseudonocardia xinjiangensis]NMH76486.1 SnoaL-like domain-containing protein [Pseudonocardia xinjiangensis]
MRRSRVVLAGILSLAAVLLIPATASAETARQPGLSTTQKAALLTDFGTALRNIDPGAMAAVVTPNVVWNFPGTSVESGRARGVKQIIARAKVQHDFGLTITVEHVTFAAHDMLAEFHTHAQRNGKTLDEYVIDDFQFRDGRISHIDSGVSEVNGVNSFFS